MCTFSKADQSTVLSLQKKDASSQAFQCPQNVTVDFTSFLLNLPKIKAFKIKLHRPFTGVIKTITIQHVVGGEYYASILIDTQSALPITAKVEANKTLGLDVGISHFYSDS